MFLDPSAPAELALLEQMLSDIPPGSPYMGWWPSDVTGESDGTQVTSQHGLFVLADDYSANLTVFGQWDLTTGAVQLTSTPQTLTLQAWVPEAADTHLQVRTATTGPGDLYASAASVRLLTPAERF